MAQAGEFFCQACGRHTSHAAEKRKQAGTPPKYCSKRCKSTGKPSVEIALGWKRLLDQAGAGGRRESVLCSDVQREVFEKVVGSGLQRKSESPGEKAEPGDNQELGMKRAKNREDTRRAARLIYHFGFQHFQPNTTPSSSTSEDSATSSSNYASFRATGTKMDDNMKLEAVQNGKVIQDVTHAKGEWGLRYRRD